MAQSEFLIAMNMRMQARGRQSSIADAHAVELLRRELEPVVIADVRGTYPGFTPDRWSHWESWERRGLVRDQGAEVEAVTFERNAGESRVRFRRLPPPRNSIGPGEMPPSWPMEECDALDFIEVSLVTDSSAA